MATQKTEPLPTAHDLVRAGMRSCDYWRDSEAARDQMRRDCMEIPAQQRADLIQHFEETYR